MYNHLDNTELYRAILALFYRDNQVALDSETKELFGVYSGFCNNDELIQLLYSKYKSNIAIVESFLFLFTNK